MTTHLLFRRFAPFLLVLAAAGCVRSAEGAAEGQVRVVATTGMIGDAVREIGGEHVHVTTLMGPGVDPHVYKAREGDVRALAAADLVFYNGLHLEARMGEVLERMRGDVRTVAVAEGLPTDTLLRPPEFAGAYDPHVWHDASLWKDAVQRIAAALIAEDAAHAATYRTRAGRFVAQLDSLDAWALSQTARIPPERRVLVTAHDAFNYFGRRYGLDVRGLQGISTATEAGTRDVQQLAEFIAERRIPAVFVESSISPRTIEAVQAAVRARGFDVRIGGQLYSDALGTGGTPEGTYIGMFRHNVTTVVGGLLGAPAPARVE